MDEFSGIFLFARVFLKVTQVKYNTRPHNFILDNERNWIHIYTTALANFNIKKTCKYSNQKVPEKLNQCVSYYDREFQIGK